MLAKLLKKTTVLVVVAAVMGGYVRSSYAQTISENTPEPTAEVTADMRPVQILLPVIVSMRPHDPAAFTQGLELHDGMLYESTGLEGQSTLREVNPETGEVVRRVDMPADVFAEGLTLVGDQLVQLTWKNGVVYRYDFDTFDLLDTFEGYSQEGWGICYDGVHLYTSDGSSQIIERDAETLEETGRLDVLLQGQPVGNLNELECVGDSIYANVWYTDAIVKIDKADGRVSAVVDARRLLTAEQHETLTSGSVMNGIAYDEETGNFLITGKRWGWLFEVEFVPASGD